MEYHFFCRELVSKVFLQATKVIMSVHAAYYCDYSFRILLPLLNLTPHLSSIMLCGYAQVIQIVRNLTFPQFIVKRFEF